MDRVHDYRGFTLWISVGALTARMLKDISDVIVGCFADWANADFLKSAGLMLMGPEKSAEWTQTSRRRYSVCSARGAGRG